MAITTGSIRKMQTTFGGPAHGESGSPVQYRLPIGEGSIPLNPLLGQPVRFKFTGRIFCLNCGKATKTSFSQGYCFTCMQSLAACDMCIVRPETCHYHLGTCREPSWGEAHCFIDHTVYLANSSGIKVGITRSHQMKTRWMDQGAVQALPIVRVKNRRDSGLVETTLAKLVPDKTNWRLMLKGIAERVDLKTRRDGLFEHLGPELPGEKLYEEEIQITYPVLRYPEKAISLNLDKVPEVKGELLGVKGQYLILDVGVINMRKYGGYELEWEAESGSIAPEVPKPAEAVTVPVSAPSPAPSARQPAAASAPTPSIQESGQTSLF